MASSYSFLDTYCDVLKFLPNEFYRYISLLRHLDAEAQKCTDRMVAIEDNLFRSTRCSIPSTPIQGQALPNLLLLQELRLVQMRGYHLQKEKVATVKETHMIIADYMMRLEEEMTKFAKEFPNGMVPEGEEFLFQSMK